VAFARSAPALRPSWDGDQCDEQPPQRHADTPRQASHRTAPVRVGELSHADAPRGQAWVTEPSTPVRDVAKASNAYGTQSGAPSTVTTTSGQCGVGGVTLGAAGRPTSTHSTRTVAAAPSESPRGRQSCPAPALIRSASAQTPSWTKAGQGDPGRRATHR
jgi:hypothetical protein